MLGRVHATSDPVKMVRFLDVVQQCRCNIVASCCVNMLDSRTRVVASVRMCYSWAEHISSTYAILAVVNLVEEL